MCLYVVVLEKSIVGGGIVESVAKISFSFLSRVEGAAKILIGVYPDGAFLPSLMLSTHPLKTSSSVGGRIDVAGAHASAAQFEPTRCVISKTKACVRNERRKK